MTPAIATDEAALRRYYAFLAHEMDRARASRAPGLISRTVAGKRALLLKTLKGVRKRGVILEFGVFRGRSVQMMAGAAPLRKIYGFDSFKGFPDDGRKDWKQDFSVERLPWTPPNVRLIPGWFAETLPPFLETLNRPLAMVHIDCDIYSSSRTVLETLREKDLLKPGLTIVFDELFNYKDFAWNEMLALHEMQEATGLGFDWLYAGPRIAAPEEVFVKTLPPTGRAKRKAGFGMAASIRLTKGPTPERDIKPEQERAFAVFRRRTQVYYNSRTP